MTFGSVAVAWLLMPPIDYLPKGNRNLILSIVQVPPGYNLDQIQRILIEIEGRYSKLPQIQRLFAVSRLQNPLLGVVVKRVPDAVAYEKAEPALIEKLLEVRRRLVLADLGDAIATPYWPA